MTPELATVPATELYRQSTDIANLCKEIVCKTAMEIQGRKFVRVEGWMSIATAHGCLASTRDVERIEGGVRCIGEIRRMTDGVVLASAEGFVGEDEPTWFGGDVDKWANGKLVATRHQPKRPDYAIRAMCQTRAISRACRSAFAHVVVLMDAGLSTTPAEEVPAGGFEPEPDGPREKAAREANRHPEPSGAGKGHYGQTGVSPEPFTGDWREVECHFGKNKGLSLGKMTPRQRDFYYDNAHKPSERPPSKDDLRFLAALDAMAAEQHGGKTFVKKEPSAVEHLAALGDSLDLAKIPTETFLLVACREGWTNAGKWEEILPEQALWMSQNSAQVVALCLEEAP